MSMMEQGRARLRGGSYERAEPKKMYTKAALSGERGPKKKPGDREGRRREKEASRFAVRNGRLAGWWHVSELRWVCVQGGNKGSQARPF